MSLLSTLLNVFNSFTISVFNGFQYLPATKIKDGTLFSDMQLPVNYADKDGKYFLGQSFSSNSVLSQPSFEESPEYKPGETTPPRAYPTSQPNGYEVPLGTNEASLYQFSAEGIRHLKDFEGLHQRPYFINETKYIGYGHKLPKDDTTTYISIDQAESYLTGDISAIEGVVKGAISEKITQGQFDAMVDFAFTMDSSSFKSSDVVKLLNSGDIAGACTALAQWCYIQQNGVVSRSAHLTSRRTGNARWMSMAVDPGPVS